MNVKLHRRRRSLSDRLRFRSLRWTVVGLSWLSGRRLWLALRPLAFDRLELLPDFLLGDAPLSNYDPHHLPGPKDIQWSSGQTHPPA